MDGAQLLALPEGLLRMWGLLKCQFLCEESGLVVFHAAFPSNSGCILEHQP